MRSNEKIALILPTLREAQCLPGLLREIRGQFEAFAIPFEILVVDDDSRDGTEQIVRSMAAEDYRVRLLLRKQERGLAGAILHGWQHTDATILGVMDADGQHPPEVLPRLIAEIERGCDLAVASRFAPGAAVAGCGVVRRAVSKASIWLTRPLQPAGLRVHDPLSGYFLVRRRCVENILFRPTGFKLLLEVLVRGRVRSVREIPFTFRRRGAGRSKAGLRVGWEYLQLLVQLYRVHLLTGRVANAPAD